MRARQYDPRLGRFTQTDPLQIKRPFQHYAYALNAPVSVNDPHGQDGELREAFKLGWDLYKKAVDPLASIRRTIVQKTKEVVTQFLNSIDTAGKPVEAFATEVLRGQVKLVGLAIEKAEGTQQTLSDPLGVTIQGVQTKIALIDEALEKGVVEVGLEGLEAEHQQMNEDPSGYAMEKALTILHLAAIADAPEGRGSNNSVVRKAASTGQEAHRQLEAGYAAKGYETEKVVTLKGGRTVRKDAVKGKKAVIIKPDTPTGREAAANRAKLMKDNGWDPKVDLYDPDDPRFQPGSPTYIGPRKR